MVRSALLAAVLAIALADCGGGGAAMTPAPSATISASAASAVTTSAGAISAASAGPIAGDPLPPENGQPVVFATCVPVYNDLVYTSSFDWTQVGCASNVTAPSPSNEHWALAGATQPTIKCTLRYDVNAGDVILFFCEGDPFG